jgi:L-rhamnose mutarotase
MMPSRSLERGGLSIDAIDSESRWAAIAKTPECQHWWHHMDDVMPHDPDNALISEEIVEGHETVNLAEVSEILKTMIEVIAASH